ncbi:MAG: adenylosuccinate synthetase [Candidatus Aenigmatarchaeota archaeon]
MISLVVDGQYGDTGKGKVAAYLASMGIDYSVRGGSVNAGHTVGKYKFSQIPCAALFPGIQLRIAAGAMVDPETFLKEVNAYGVQDRIKIDANAGVIEPRHRQEEEVDASGSAKAIGTTRKGIGPARIDRMRRVGAKLAKDVPELSPYVQENVAEELYAAHLNQGRIVVEGVQGYNLSLFHGTFPYVTTIDTTASELMSEVGLGPRLADRIYLVFKAYITRVGEGPLSNEISFEEAERRGIAEIATVSRRNRRSALLFDSNGNPNEPEFARMRNAVIANSPTDIVITCLDKLFPQDAGKKSGLSDEAVGFLERYWNELYKSPSILHESRAPISLVGTGPEIYETARL